jgi:hypothetical protein
MVSTPSAAEPLPEDGKFQAARVLCATLRMFARRRRLLLAITGYTAREILRFPNGSLMSYRRHQAGEV